MSSILQRNGISLHSDVSARWSSKPKPVDLTNNQAILDTQVLFAWSEGRDEEIHWLDAKRNKLEDIWLHAFDSIFE